MSAFKPLVEKLENLRLPRVLSILLVYVLIIAIIAFVGSTILPPFITQTIHLVQSLPDYTSRVLPFLQIDSQFITQQVTPMGENLLKVTVGVFSNIVAVFSVFVISFYLLIERKQFEPFLITFMGASGSERITTILKKVEERLGAWVRGELTLMLFIGLTTYLGLIILGIPFSLPLSILSGLLEIIPVIGPIISAIPAILVAVTVSPLLALATALLYFTVQQVEAHLVIPFVMKRAVGLPPLVTIISLMIGAKLAGVVGAILAVPIVVTIETVISEYLGKKGSR